MNRCDICLEETCDGKKDCNCKDCKVADECPRKLHPTIRITNKCTQQCIHCCFSSKPTSTQQMSIEQAEIISKFLKTNEIDYINVMGGEFFCNPKWKEILELLINSIDLMRLVSNGDWAGSDDISNEVIEFFSKYKNKIYVCISGDKWHTKKNIEKAEDLLKQANIIYKISTDKEMPDSAIVPVGRSVGNGGIYGMIATYCGVPEHKYSFLIDELGNIYKCVWGVIKYANVKDYVNDTFYARFKEINKKFYEKVFTPSCNSCYMYWKFRCKEDLCVSED